MSDLVGTQIVGFLTHMLKCFPFFISVSPDTGEVAQADASELIKIVGITCGALVSILIISLVCIRLCRVSAKKKKERYDLNV